MREQYTLAVNTTSPILYVVISGISGGKDEPLVQYLASALQESGTTASIQFANDPNYNDQTLPAMNELPIKGYLDCLDHVIKIASAKHSVEHIVLIAHSFSAVIATYYLANHLEDQGSRDFTLISIDNDDSDAALKYIDSLDDMARKDPLMNPFSPSTIQYLRDNPSKEALDHLPRAFHVEADEFGADHEFASDESRRLLLDSIHAIIADVGIGRS